MKDQIQITLSNEEAIVLFEFLSRFANDDQLEIVDASEKQVLWDLLAELEHVLREPLSEKYVTILEDARDRLRKR